MQDEIDCEISDEPAEIIVAKFHAHDWHALPDFALNRKGITYFSLSIEEVCLR